MNKDYYQKYIKYKGKYLELKGGKEQRYKLVEDPPKIKQVRYHNGILKYYNNMDDDNLDQYSEFMLGSVTKIFTAFIILILQQEGKLDINNKIDKYIPSNEKNDFSQATIYELVSHTSGMKKWVDDQLSYMKKWNNATEVAKTIIKKEKLFVGKKGKYVYSNSGFVLLGMIIEKVTEKSYDKVYKEYIFDKLEMNSTGVGKTNITLYNRIGKKLSEIEFNDRYLASSSGAFYSCVDDMIKFAKKCFSLLDENSREIMSTKLNIMYEQKETKQIFFGKSGGISGGKAFFEGMYDKKYNFKHTYIDFYAIAGGWKDS